MLPISSRYHINLSSIYTTHYKATANKITNTPIDILIRDKRLTCPSTLAANSGLGLTST
jgi:hypothetical protein